MTPGEILSALSKRGFRLTLRPGGLHLTSPEDRGDPPLDLFAQIAEHRPSLIEVLESEARAVEAHEASLAAGRVTTLDPRLRDYVHPSIRHL
jgi:hypothetical protein